MDDSIKIFDEVECESSVSRSYEPQTTNYLLRTIILFAFLLCTHTTHAQHLEHIINMQSRLIDSVGLAPDTLNNVLYLKITSDRDVNLLRIPPNNINGVWATRNFGNIRIGSKDSITGHIATTIDGYNSEVIISSISIKNGIMFRMRPLINTPTTIYPTYEGVAIFVVSFSPTAIGDYSDTITVIHSGTISGSISPSIVLLRGRGVEPVITITPDTLDFGDVLVSTSSNKTFKITNYGNIDLVISSMILSGTDAGQFDVTPSSITIPPNQSRNINVQFLPTTVGEKNVQLNIIHNSSTIPNSVSLTGTCISTISVNEPENLMSDGSNFLFQSSPNPIRLGYDATIRYRLTNAGTINLTIYDVLGREVTKLINEYKSEGTYSVTFNTKGLPSGVYLYKLRAPGYEGLKKMVIVH